LIGDQAAGADIALKNLGMLDRGIATSFGGLGMVVERFWEPGIETAWKIHLDTAPALFAEAVVNTFWALLTGQVTHDTVHPEWRMVWDKGDTFQLSNDLDPVHQVPMIATDENGNAIILAERNFSQMALPLLMVTQDNFREFLAWGDLYEFGPDATEDELNYPQFPRVTDINLFQLHSEPWFVYTDWPRNW
jgi:hypothetical protein